jgi:ribosome modulation factor
MMWATRGSVDLLVIFYSINVFITFSLSQAGMVRHWWQERATEDGWRHKLAINGFGLVLTASILVSLTLVKFNEGGWATLAGDRGPGLHRVRHQAPLQRGPDAAQPPRQHRRGRGDGVEGRARDSPPFADPKARTAVILVNGFNGLGLHTILNVPRMFGNTFRNFLFVQVGSVDAGNFKGAADIDALRAHTESEAQRYVQFAQARGYGSKAYTAIGYDVTSEVMKLARQAADEFPNQVFFAGPAALHLRDEPDPVAPQPHGLHASAPVLPVEHALRRPADQGRRLRPAGTLAYSEEHLPLVLAGGARGLQGPDRHVPLEVLPRQADLGRLVAVVRKPLLKHGVDARGSASRRPVTMMFWRSVTTESDETDGDERRERGVEPVDKACCRRSRSRHPRSSVRLLPPMTTRISMGFRLGPT